MNINPYSPSFAGRITVNEYKKDGTKTKTVYNTNQKQEEHIKRYIDKCMQNKQDGLIPHDKALDLHKALLLQTGTFIMPTHPNNKKMMGKTGQNEISFMEFKDDKLALDMVFDFNLIPNTVKEGVEALSERELNSYAEFVILKAKHCLKQTYKKMKEEKQLTNNDNTNLTLMKPKMEQLNSLLVAISDIEQYMYMTSEELFVKLQKIEQVINSINSINKD